MSFCPQESRMVRPLLYAITPALLLIGACVLLADDADDGKSLPPPAARQVEFVRDIQPIFAERCNSCHGEDEQEGQLRLDAKAIVLRGGKSGRLLAAGDSAGSLLIKRLAGQGGGKRMPLD